MQLRFQSFGYSNETMVFENSFSALAPPDLYFDAKKVRGYKVHVSYLTGDDTILSQFSTYYSIAGIKLELIGRSR